MSKNVESGRKQQNLLGGAATLAFALVLVKILGALYKIPMNKLFGGSGAGYFSTAYEFFTPFYTIALAGLPVALSKMVASYATKGRYKDVRKVRKVAVKVYAFTGTLSFLILAALAYPYVMYVDNIKALPSILLIAPSLFFCCLMSSYRGYYNGLRNMVPTAMSQVMEALGKIVMGLAMMYGTYAYLMNEFDKKGTILGKVVEMTDSSTWTKGVMPTLRQIAERQVGVYTAAAAIFGVTFGAAIGALFMVIYNKRKGEGFTKLEIDSSDEPDTQKYMVKTLIAIAIPVVIGSLVSTFGGMVDAIMVQRQLKGLMETNGAEMIKQYMSLMPAANPPEDIPNFLYGCYKNFSYSLYLLIPTICESLAISALTTLTVYWAKMDTRRVRSTIESTLRITALIAIPAGIGISVLSGSILGMLYRRNPGEVAVATPLLQYLGFAAIFSAISIPMVSMLQAIGKQKTAMVNILIGVVLKIAVNYVLVGNVNVNISGAAIGSLVCYAYTVIANFICLCLYSKTVPNILSVFLKPLFAGALCGVAAWATSGLIGKYISSNAIKTVGAIAAAGVVYVLALTLIRGLMREDIEMLPKGKKIAETLAKLRIIG